MKIPIWRTKAVLAGITAFLLFSGCGVDKGRVSTGESTSNGATITLNWPAGYSYNQATGEIIPPSGERHATLPAYVTQMTLTITGEGIDPPVVLNVPLDTLSVSFAVTPGIRTFTVVIETSIPELTFTASQTIDLEPGAQVRLDFNLTINAPPVVSSVGASNATPMTGAAIGVSCNATDPDGNPMSYAWSDGEAGGAFTGSGASVSYTAAKGGSITITCTVSDGKGGTASGSVTIAANGPPVVNSVTASDYTPNTGATIVVSCNATDPDDDPLSYSWSDGGAGGTFAGSGWTVDYTVPILGSITITCTVSDGLGGVASLSMTINGGTSPIIGGNSPPVVNSVTASDYTPNKGTTIVVMCNANDPDGDPLTYAWTDGGAGGTFTGAGWTVDYTVPIVGLIAITCTVSDGLGGVASLPVNINGINSPPVISSVTVSDAAPQAGATITGTCVATDVNNDPITYSWSDGLGWNDTGGTVSYTTTQMINIQLTCQANDGQGGQDIGMVAVAVGKALIGPLSSAIIPYLADDWSMQQTIGGAMSATCNPNGNLVTMTIRNFNDTATLAAAPLILNTNVTVNWTAGYTGKFILRVANGNGVPLGNYTCNLDSTRVMTLDAGQPNPDN